MGITELPLKALSASGSNSVAIAVPEPAETMAPLEDWDFSTAAIEVHNVHLTYGSQLNPVPVLKNLSMTVPRGSIYGLLGASGCGKTSLIRCILGMLKFSTGEISVFGHRPGSAESSVPGSGVGYMPQEITLYEDLTINETLRYFASLFGLSRAQVKERSQFLIDFLELPDPNRLVRNLSGGQRRRVSLATALIHKPPLLILDEPTVGVDPILRQSIWSHLIELSEKEQLTVLITTHYIEEARDAHQIGLMRHGQMLAQDSPAAMLTHYGLPSLEAVFLHLCTKAEADRRKPQVIGSSSAAAASAATASPPAIAATIEAASAPSSSNSSRRSSVSSSGSSGVVSLPDYERKVTVPGQLACSSGRATRTATATSAATATIRPRHKSVSWCSQVGAMFMKNVTTIRRNVILMLFQFMLPTIEVILFCACIGLNLHSIPVAVYDGDQSAFSERILNTLNPDVIKQKMFNSSEDAIEAVRHGFASTALTMCSNFSNYLFDRMMSMGQEIDPAVLHNSTIHLHPDMSNQLMVLAVQEEVINVFLRVGQSYLEENGLSTALLEMPVKMEEPVAIPLTAMVLVVERKQGLIERSIVAGASYLRILVALLIPQIIILFVSSLALMIFVFPVFGLSYHGEFALILLLTFLQSICGMCFGVLVSTLAKDENSATMIALGFFYPNLLLSGTVWPIEAMTRVQRYFAILLPQTIPIASMRNIISRGWTIFSFEVASGFLVSIAWIIVFVVLSTFIFRYRKA
ncbi:hypothetical protein TYRP_019686 [Tyrophagus putrescentiae]|nr:hypothetical protein TYRP_019686 [Tyrophagus putrescentiae]